MITVGGGATGAAAHARWYGRSVERASNRARNASFVSPACSLCSCMQRNERGVQRYSSFITVTRLRIDASSHGETANGAAASAKSELVTYAYYVRTLKYYPPAIYHGQGLARYGRMGSDYYPMSKSEDCYNTLEIAQHPHCAVTLVTYMTIFDVLMYSLSSIQWYPWLQKSLTWSHNQHLPTVLLQEAWVTVPGAGAIQVSRSV